MNNFKLVKKQKLLIYRVFYNLGLYYTSNLCCSYSYYIVIYGLMSIENEKKEKKFS